ncbi:MAG TPA: hypothetical protein VK672_05885, partial [Solirubrobacteraceae bacterium]|nr:hypothetical protein [Solirubrobacteraceae bacterium]
VPAIAGGSQELDAQDAGDERSDATPTTGPIEPAQRSAANGGASPADPSRQPEVAFLALLAGAATIAFGIVPQPLFNLVHGVGSALGLL